MSLLSNVKKKAGRLFGGNDIRETFLVYEEDNANTGPSKSEQITALKYFLKRFCNSKNYDDLDKAITSASPDSDCVIYRLTEEEKNVFGLQLCQYPHFECCKLFRNFNIITQNQLIPISTCLYPFQGALKMQYICFNPYHYNIKPPPANPRVFVPLNAPARTEVSRHIEANKTFIDGVPNLSVHELSKLIESNENRDQGLRNSFTINQLAYRRQNKLKNDSSLNGEPINFSNNRGSVSQDSLSTVPCKTTSENLSMTSSPLISSPTSSTAIEASPQGYLSEDNDIDVATRDPYYNFRRNFEDQKAHDDEAMDISDTSLVMPELKQFEKIFEKLSNDYPHGVNRYNLSNNESEKMATDIEEFPNVDKSTVSTNNLDVISVEYAEAMFWCFIAYYEGRHRVGIPYIATRMSIIIDGFTAPSDDFRFCLGDIENVNRTKDAIDVRTAIGNGVRIYNLGGDVYCENLSEYPVFIQSPIAGYAHKCPATVFKVPTACNFKAFSMDVFRNLLDNAVKESFDATFALTRICTMRLSFVKGWGNAYRRQLVIDTPCWLEIHFNGPLEWLDSVLELMGPPPNRCTSYS